MVQPRAEDHHRAALGDFGIGGEFACHLNDRLARHARDRALERVRALREGDEGHGGKPVDPAQYAAAGSGVGLEAAFLELTLRTFYFGERFLFIFPFEFEFFSLFG
jgi:hypothetical protein